LGEGLWEATDVVLEFSVVGEELNVSTIDLDATFLSQLDVLVSAEGSEAPVLGHDDLLSSWELVLGAAEGFDGGCSVGISGSDREENLSDVDAGDFAVWLSKGAAHAGLQSISSGTGQHLVDANDVVWVGADTHVETFLSGNLD